MSLSSRFPATGRPFGGLRDKIGTVSITYSLEAEELWNEFWDKISHTQIISLEYPSHQFLLFLIWWFSLYAPLIFLPRSMLSMFEDSNGDVDNFTILILILVNSIVLYSLGNWWMNHQISYIRELCSEYSPRLEGIGLRTECQQAKDERSIAYYKYFYPTYLDFLRLEVANDSVYGCSSVNKQPMIPLRAHFPMSHPLVAADVWEQFVNDIEKNTEDYTKAYRQAWNLSRIIYAFLLLLLLLSSKFVSNDVLMDSGWISFLSLFMGLVLWMSLLDKKVKEAKNMLQFTVDEYLEQFQHAGIDLEFRKEYDASWVWYRSKRINGP